MTPTFDLPDDLLTEVERRATKAGRNVAVEVADLLRKGLTVPDTASAEPSTLPRPVITTDLTTGLPVIVSPSDAPIHRMTTEEIEAFTDRLLMEEDLERAGISVRR